MLHEAYGVDDVISFAVTFHADRAEGTQPPDGFFLVLADSCFLGLDYRVWRARVSVPSLLCVFSS